MTAHGLTRFLRVFWFTWLGLLLWTSDGFAHGNHAPSLEITSPRSRFTTSANVIEVTVAFDARRHPADAIALLVDGVEVDRVTASTPFEELTHTFTVDLSNHPDGVAVLKARALRTEALNPQHTKYRTPRTKTVVLGSDVVRLRLDRDASDGVLVGPAGGELTSADGALTMSVPPGALQRPRQITVLKKDVAAIPPLPGGVNPTIAYELLPHGLQFAQPAQVSLVVSEDEGAGDDGAFGSGPALLLNLFDGVTEALPNQRTDVNGSSGRITVSGELHHFSDVVGAKAPGLYDIEITGVPHVIRSGETFTARIRFIPGAAIPENGTLLARVETVENRETSGYAPPLVAEPTPPDPIRNRFFDRRPFDFNVTFRCPRPGAHEFGILFQLDNLVGTFAFAYQLVFCTTPESDAGRVSTTIDGVIYQARVNPVDPSGVVGGQDPVVELFERGQTGVARVDIINLDNSILSPPRLQAGSPGELGHSNTEFSWLPVTLGTPPQSRQVIEWDCLKAGTAYVTFHFEFHRPFPRFGSFFTQDLLATVTCMRVTNAAPQIRSRAPSGSVTPGTPSGAYFYHPDAFDADGDTTVWELLIQGDDGTWSSQLPEGVQFDSSTGDVRWTPTSAQAGSYNFRLSVSDGRAQAVEDFTITVAAAPPIPATTTVPNVVNLQLGMVPLTLSTEHLTLRNVSRVFDPTFDPDHVIRQSPPAGTVVPINSPVDVEVSAAEILSALQGYEGMHASMTFNLPPGNRITIAGSNGFLVVDALTGQIPTAGSTELSFTDQGMGPFFGALVLEDPLGTGGDTIFAYGQGTAMTVFDPVAGQTGAWLVSTNRLPVTDAIHFGGDPAAPGGLYVHFAAREIYPLVPVDFGAGTVFTWRQPLAERNAFENAPGGPVSAFAWDLQFTSDGSLSPTSQGRVLVVTDGSPGRIYLVNPATPQDPALDVGAAGNQPRQMRCAPSLQLCAISNFDSDSLTIVKWDGRTTASIVGTVPVGDGPVGIGIVADGTTARVISPGFTDHSYTVTRLAADGMLLSNDTFPAPPGCTNPGHAIWLWNTPGTGVLSCNTSSSFSVVTP